MPAVIYFGSTPTGNQRPKDDLAARGIHLCKSSPSEKQPICTREFGHPSYDLYLSNISASIKAYITGKEVVIDKAKPYFYKVPNKEHPVYMKSPQVIWTYGESKTKESLDQLKSQFNATETTSGGKPALTAILSKSSFSSLLTTSPVKDTGFSVNAINCDGYMAYLRLWSVVRNIYKIQQYPLVSVHEKDAIGKFVVEKIGMDMRNGVTTFKDYTQIPASGRHVVFSNLPKKYDAHQHYFTEVAHFPNESGLIFPFEPLLARDDDAIVDLFFNQRGFFQLLGDDEREAAGVLASLQKAWKGLKMTTWGKELAHAMMGCILGVQGGAQITVIRLSTGVYGF